MKKSVTNFLTNILPPCVICFLSICLFLPDIHNFFNESVPPKNVETETLHEEIISSFNKLLDSTSYILNTTEDDIAEDDIAEDDIAEDDITKINLSSSRLLPNEEDTVVSAEEHVDNTKQRLLKDLLNKSTETNLVSVLLDDFTVDTLYWAVINAPNHSVSIDGYTVELFTNKFPVSYVPTRVDMLAKDARFILIEDTMSVFLLASNYTIDTWTPKLNAMEYQKALKTLHLHEEIESASFAYNRDSTTSLGREILESEGFEEANYGPDMLDEIHRYNTARDLTVLRFEDKIECWQLGKKLLSYEFDNSFEEYPYYIIANNMIHLRADPNEFITFIDSKGNFFNLPTNAFWAGFYEDNEIFIPMYSIFEENAVTFYSIDIATSEVTPYAIFDDISSIESFSHEGYVTYYFNYFNGKTESITLF